MREPKPMREIHAIRHKIQREDRHLSWSQRVEKTRRIAEETIRKYGLNIRRWDQTA
jgi:hypothetical protein